MVSLPSAQELVTRQAKNVTPTSVGRSPLTMGLIAAKLLENEDATEVPVPL